MPGKDGLPLKPRPLVSYRISSPSTSRSGLNLVEILLALFILAVVAIPIMNLIFGGVKDSARGRDRATAVALARNIMSQLLEKVPFEDIQAKGGPKALNPKDFFGVDAEDPGLYATREQALLGSGLDSEWERILDQDETQGDGERTIVKDGTAFEVILFAGTYKDKPSTGSSGLNEPDLNQELTFSFFKNPYVKLDPSREVEIKKQIVLDGDFPYDSDGDPSSSVDDPEDPRFRPGWPKTTKTNSDGRMVVDEGNFLYGDSGSKSSDALKKWPRITYDLSTFRENSGALMKLVLGIRWRPGTNANHKADYAKTTKEFWLVSFKAKIKEG